MDIMTGANSLTFGALTAELLGASHLVAHTYPTLATPAPQAGVFYFQELRP